MGRNKLDDRRDTMVGFKVNETERDAIQEMRRDLGHKNVAELLVWALCEYAKKYDIELESLSERRNFRSK